MTVALYLLRKDPQVLIDKFSHLNFNVHMTTGDSSSSERQAPFLPITGRVPSVSRADELVQRGEYAHAINMYNQAMKNDPENPAIHERRLAAYIAWGQVERARQILQMTPGHIAVSGVANDLRTIGATAIAFRSDFRRGQKPQIDDYVQRVDEELQHLLRRNLENIETEMKPMEDLIIIDKIATEFENAWGRGEYPQKNDYVARAETRLHGQLIEALKEAEAELRERYPRKEVESE